MDKILQKDVASERRDARSAINTIQAVRRSVVDEVLTLYKHLGEMRQTMLDGSEMSHISEMHLVHCTYCHQTALRLYGVNCAYRHISCHRHAIIANTKCLIIIAFSFKSKS